MTLNEVTPIESNHLPSSDSRLRPDQIALELGQIDLAEQEKKRVEEKQREKRKETVGTHQPQYFEMIGQGEQAGSKEWKYRGDYCEFVSVPLSLGLRLLTDVADTSPKTSGGDVTRC